MKARKRTIYEEVSAAVSFYDAVESAADLPRLSPSLGCTLCSHARHEGAVCGARISRRIDVDSWESAYCGCKGWYLEMKYRDPGLRLPV